jgi:hypothetical protein
MTPRGPHRLPHRFAVRLTGRLPVYTRDVSEGGFAAALLQPLTPGEPLTGSISIADWTVDFRGEVAWVEGSPQQLPRGRFGVRFTQLPEEFRRFLAVFQRQAGHRLPRWSTAATALPPTAERCSP